MEPIEIIVIIACILVVLSVIGTYVYKKITHKPTGECACCSHYKGNLQKMYNKKYKKCCSKNKSH